MIAISVKNGWGRFARADLDSGSPLVTQVGEISLPDPLKEPDLRSDRLPSLMGDLFHQVQEMVNTRDVEMYVSLGDEWVESDILDVDTTLSPEERESYLHWIMRQRLGSLWDDSDLYFSLLPDSRGNVDQVLVSVTVRPVIHAIQSSIQSLGAIPAWMEAGIFSLSRASTSLDDGRTTRTLTMEPLGTAFRGLFHERGQLRALAQFTLRAGKARETVTKGDKTLVSACMKDLNAYLDGEDLSPDLHVFLSGESSRHTLDMLTHSGTAEGVLTVIDPFAGLVGNGLSVPGSTGGSWYVDVRGLIEKGIH